VGRRFAGSKDGRAHNQDASHPIDHTLSSRRHTSSCRRHPHRDAEIFSYIVDGELSHADTLGNKEALGRGCVQYLSAGTGIAHSEMNDHPTLTTRFLQVRAALLLPAHVWLTRACTSAAARAAICVVHISTAHLAQVWITPDERGHTPQYGSTQFTAADRHNTLLLLLGGTGRLQGVGQGRSLSPLHASLCP